MEKLDSGEYVLYSAGTFTAAALVLIGALFWLWALVDALRIGDPAWRAAEQSKILWVLVIVLLGPLGALLYLFIPKLALRRAVA